MTAPGSSPDPRTSTPGADPLAPSSGAPASGTVPARSGPSRAGRAGRTLGRGLALALLIAVTVLLVLFVVFNGETVPISLVFTDVRAPLVVALLIAAALGALFAALLGVVMAARRRNR